MSIVEKIVSVNMLIISSLCVVAISQEPLKPLAATDDLHNAAAAGSLTRVNQLLLRNPPIDAPDANGVTPLMKAAGGGYLDVVQVLVDCGANVNAASMIKGYTVLHFAAESGKVDVVMDLLSRGANPSVASIDGLRPSELARAKGYEAVGAAIDEFKQWGDDAPEDVLDMVKRLLADPNAIRGHIGDFPEIKAELETINQKGTVEEKAWVSRRPMQRGVLAKAFEAQIGTELKFIEDTADQEKAVKTTEAVKGDARQWQDRMVIVDRKLRELRRDMQMGDFSGATMRSVRPVRPKRSDLTQADPNKVDPEKERIALLEEEVKAWTEGMDSSQTLCGAVHEQVMRSLGRIHQVASGEKVKKTIAVVEGIMLSRELRYQRMLREYAAQDQAQAGTATDDGTNTARGAKSRTMPGRTRR